MLKSCVLLDFSSLHGTNIQREIQETKLIKANET